MIFFSGVFIHAEDRAVSVENQYKGEYTLDAPFWGGDAKYIINDEAVTSSNDTIVSGWVDVTGCFGVELMFQIDDTCRIDYQVDYSFGIATDATNGYLTVAGVGTDSIKTTGTANANLIKGVLLKGYGTSAITNLIPGANFIRVRCYRFVGAGAYASEATNTLRVGINRLK